MDDIKFDEIVDQPCPEGWEFSRVNIYSTPSWSHLWHPVDFDRATIRCVILMREDNKYYASYVSKNEDIGPYDTLAEACAVADFLIR